jgi:amino-acid N-acetyltransferase
VEQSPTFDQYQNGKGARLVDEGQIYHLALVKLSGTETLDDATVQGIGLTLSQLSRLSMTPCVVLAPLKSAEEVGLLHWRQQLSIQAERLSKAIFESSGVEARVMDNIYCLSGSTDLPTIFSRKLLMSPIRNGKIPIILPLAYKDESQSISGVAADRAIIALTREFASVNVLQIPEEEQTELTQRVKTLRKQISLDRLIILDPQGGIPHPAVPGSDHVFLNMEQEYNEVRKELEIYAENPKMPSCAQPTPVYQEAFSATMSGLSKISLEESRENVAKELFTANQAPNQEEGTRSTNPDYTRHLLNLDLLRGVLAYLPPSSSAIVTTPVAAAKSSKGSFLSNSFSGVGTRTQKNPLIHNLLTDKPAYSASLPMGRLGRSNDPTNIPSVVSTPTFVKRGMPLTILPDPRTTPWTADTAPRLKLTDPRIDLPRLIHLIEDSFNRKLDIDHYLSRVNDRIAGLVIAGEYEGGALFTWETPPGISPSDISRQVPYLDKFAVLKRAQGAGGVADILFNAMVRGCFPNGVCWRSRRDNPVNKWYFERARGTWKLPGQNWTMFWTTEGVEGGKGVRFSDYEAVCRGVEPSWTDRKRAAD